MRRGRQHKGEIRRFRVEARASPNSRLADQFHVTDWFGTSYFQTGDHEEAWREATRLNEADLSLRTADKRWTKFNHR